MASNQYKKKVKPGKIELDDAEPMLIVNIETQLIDLSKPKQTSIVDRKCSQKKIRLKAFTPSSNLVEVAKEVVNKCKYIHPSKGAHVQALLQLLKDRMVSTSATVPVAVEDARERSAPSSPPSTRDKPTAPPQDKGVNDDEDDEDEDDDPKTIEGVREEEELKAAAVIEQAQIESKEDIARLQKLERRRRRKAAKRECERLFQANVPKEKAKMEKLDSYVELLYEDDMDEMVKGTYLILQLVRDEYNIPVFVENDTTLGALTRVLNENRKKNTELVTNILEILFCFSNFSPLHHILLDGKIGDTTMRVIDLECKRYDIRFANNNNSNNNNNNNISDPKGKTTFKFLARQEKLLYVAFYILLNLAEDVSIEVKMVKRGIIGYLIRILDRQHSESILMDELQMLAVIFLKKLSIFSENKAEMHDLGLVKKLLALLPHDNDDVFVPSLRLLYNLSFDAEICDEFVKPTALKMFCQALSDKKASVQAVLGKLLYNISLDTRHRASLVSAGVFSVTLGLVLRSPKRFIDRELGALAVNLSTASNSASLLVSDREVLHQLVKRVHLTNDPLLMKLLHNLSVHPGKHKEAIAKYIHEIVGMAKRTQNHDFLVEALGTVAQLDVPRLAFSKVVAQNDLVEFLLKHLVPGFTDDDIVLETVMLLGTISADPKAAPLLANTRLIRLLSQTLTEKAEDVTIVAQSLFTIYRFLLHDETRQIVLANDGLISSLVSLQQNDENEAVRSQASNCLSIVSEFVSEDWKNKFKNERFEAHNREWLDVVVHHHEFSEDSRPESQLYSDERSHGEFGWQSKSPSPTANIRFWEDQFYRDNLDEEGHDDED